MLLQSFRQLLPGIESEFRIPRDPHFRQTLISGDGNQRERKFLQGVVTLSRDWQNIACGIKALAWQERSNFSCQSSLNAR